jgi:hypothetical protein
MLAVLFGRGHRVEVDENIGPGTVASGIAVGGRLGRIGDARVAGRPRCHNANIFPALKASTKIKCLSRA